MGHDNSSVDGQRNRRDAAPVSIIGGKLLLSAPPPDRSRLPDRLRLPDDGALVLVQWAILHMQEEVLFILLLFCDGPSQ